MSFIKRIINFFNKKDNIIRGNGNIITEVKEVKNFSEIISNCSVDVIYNKSLSSEPSLKIIGDSNLIELIKISVIKKTLVIDLKRNVRFKGKITIECSSNNINKVNLNGSSLINLIDIDELDLKLNLNGSGYILASGNVKSLESTILGSGNLSLNLNVKTLFIKIIGSGNFDNIGKSKISKVHIEGSGNVNLKCSDSLTCMLHGSGNIDHNDISNIANVEVHGSGSVLLHCRESFSGFLFGSGDIKVYGNPKIRKSANNGSGRIKFLT